MRFELIFSERYIHQFHPGPTQEIPASDEKNKSKSAGLSVTVRDSSRKVSHLSKAI